LESGLLTTPEFTDFTKKVIPFLHVTTRIDDRPNDGLLIDKGGTGFPTLMYLDENGTVLGRPGGRDVESFDTGLVTATETVNNIKDLKKRIAAGDKAAANELFIIEMNLGKYDLAELKEKAKGLKKLTKEQKAELAGYMLNLRVEDVLKTAGRTEESLAAAGKKLMAIKAEGKLPTGDTLGSFWFVLMGYAEAEKNADLFEEALAALKVFYADNSRAMDFLNKKDAVLKEMRDGPEEETVVEGR